MKFIAPVYYMSSQVTVGANWSLFLRIPHFPSIIALIMSSLKLGLKLGLQPLMAYKAVGLTITLIP